MAEPVQVIGFYQTGDARLGVAEDFLELYSRHTSHLTYTFYNPYTEQALAESYKLCSYGLIFVSGMNRYEIHKVNEQAITKGLMVVTTPDHNSKNKDIVSAPVKTPTNRQLFLTPLQAGAILLVNVVIIPFAVLLAGVRIWWLRR